MRLSSMMWVVVVVCAASLLYSVKYQVQTMDREIASIRAQIAEERAAIHVLKAEWAYLSRPERVRDLAEKHLAMEPMNGKQMLELADIPFSPDMSVQLASGETHIAAYGSTSNNASMSQMRPGIIPAGGAGYVR